MSAPGEIVTVITAATAFVAVVLGPAVSLYVVRRQFAASVLSKNRQEWIDKVRNTVAEILALLETLDVTYKLGLDSPDIPAQLHRLQLLEATLSLLLNPKEEDHVQLLAAVTHADRQIGERQPDKAVLVPRALSDEITLQAQKILKREWERVKKGG